MNTTNRKGPWMQLQSGRPFWPLDPRVEDIRIEDIAHGLSNQCRFAGQCRAFYSVAQHCVHVAQWLRFLGYSPEIQCAGLLHDASEAYCVDVPRPLKGELKGYADVENPIQRKIEEAFNLLPHVFDSKIIHLADDKILATEKRDLMQPAPMAWCALPDPWDNLTIVPWEPLYARAQFLNAFETLACLPG